MKDIDLNDLLNASDWQDFMGRMESASKSDRGGLFEQICCHYLKWHPVYSTVYKEVWLHRDIPLGVRQACNIPKLDGGLDAYALTHDGRYVGIQCKYLSDTKGSLSRSDFSTAVDQAFTQCRNISSLVLMTTKEKLTSAAGRYHVPVTGITLESWLELQGEAFDQFKAHLQGKLEKSRPIPYKPRPHQARAIENAIRHFLTNENARGKLIHPCGAGKSLTGFWIGQELGAKSIVVAVPSLTLVRQTYNTWLREYQACAEDIEWIAVCSDKTVGKLSQSEQDDVVTSLIELGIESHTEPEFISDWLSKDNGRKKVVFTTYQSGQALAEGVKRAGFAFDLGIFDEAHKTVGQSTKLFSHLLFDENIPVRKRIYMTATERVFRGSRDVILSMDDPDIYGETFEFFSFKQAIESDPPVLTDYKVLVLAVTQAEIRQYIEDNVLIRTKGVRWDEDVEASMLASLIALNKAHQKYSIHHTVSFHSSIAKAVSFKESQQRLNELGLFPEMTTYHVTGKTSTSERNREIEAFAANENALITNARCLTEGVDVPNIDCVLFADPRRSRVDIVQAIGRALRKAPNKPVGYILIPIVIDPVDNLEDQARRTYREIVSILQSLATQDERIIDELKVQVSESQSKGSQLISYDLQDIRGLLLEELIDGLTVKVWSTIKRLAWPSYHEAREAARALGLNGESEWRSLFQSKGNPTGLPYHPERVYKDSGWKGWGDWLGTGYIASQKRKYLTYAEAENFSRKLRLRSSAAWREYIKSGSLPEYIPANPHSTYRHDGWVSWGKWLDTNRIATNKRTYLPFEEAREYVRSLGLKNQAAWTAYVRSGKKPSNIPSTPREVYAKEGWKNLGDWLGTLQVASREIRYRPFEDAREFARGLGLTRQKDWFEFCKSDVYN